MAAVQQAPLLVQYEREEMMFENDEYEDLGELSGESTRSVMPLPHLGLHHFQHRSAAFLRCTKLTLRFPILQTLFFPMSYPTPRIPRFRK
jgi:hypothetical protein